MTFGRRKRAAFEECCPFFVSLRFEHSNIVHSPKTGDRTYAFGLSLPRGVPQDVLPDLSCSTHYVRSDPYRGLGPVRPRRPTFPSDMTYSRMDNEASDVSENDEEDFG
ncbi:hypothetical protein MRX96_020865 [Rhipicephalus microplus]